MSVACVYVWIYAGERECAVVLGCAAFVFVLGRVGVCVRQWPEVYDSCRTFLHVARVRKHTDMR